jgi:hypothetical protein
MMDSTHCIDMTRYQDLSLSLAAWPSKDVEPERILGENLLLDMIAL